MLQSQLVWPYSFYTKYSTSHDVEDFMSVWSIHKQGDNYQMLLNMSSYDAEYAAPYSVAMASNCSVLFHSTECMSYSHPALLPSMYWGMTIMSWDVFKILNSITMHPWMAPEILVSWFLL